MTVIRTADRSAKKDQPRMVLSGAKQLTGVPGECGTVERDQNNALFGATSQQGDIVQAQPHSVLPIGDVNDGEAGHEPPAGRHEAMRRVLVRQQAERHAALLPAIGELATRCGWSSTQPRSVD